MSVGFLLKDVLEALIVNRYQHRVGIAISAMPPSTMLNECALLLLCP